MRGSFTRTLVNIAEQDPRVILLTADLGFMVLEPFAERFPDRFINVGVAEQNAVGLATGLAESGFIPFVYSIATFASLRPYEFIRNGPILHQLPVRIVGVGGGFDYGPAGSTHHALEDIGVMRTQPGLTVIAPADYRQTATALRATWDLPGPVYYRLGKDDHTAQAGLEGRFDLGRAQLIRPGADLLIISTGSITTEALTAAESLAAANIDCAVMVVASLNPPPVDDLAIALDRYPLALTVEAHYVNGGLGSLVAEVVAEHQLDCKVVRCAIKTQPGAITGSQQALQAIHGLSAGHLAETARQRFQELQR